MEMLCSNKWYINKLDHKQDQKIFLEKISYESIGKI